MLNNEISHLLKLKEEFQMQKTDQLKLLGNIIEFPKNKEFKNKEIQDKFYVATELLKRIIEHGHEFNITVTRLVLTTAITSLCFTT